MAQPVQAAEPRYVSAFRLPPPLRYNRPLSITADQERAFYDAQYARLLALPDHALATSRQVLERDLANPAHPVYERRRLYQRILRILTEQPAANRTVLDYGCGPGDWGLLLAAEGARVTFLDLSPVAIELVLRRARASGTADRVRGIARDASDLSCFADAEFDLIYGSAALHHTLKYAHALDELLRVLRPGGLLVLAETYGNNPLLNFARRLRWRLSRQPDEAGEEILFGADEVAALRRRMSSVEVMPLNLLAMAKRLFRGHFTNPIARAIVAALEAADRILLTIAPVLRKYCGEVIIVARR